VREQIIGKGVQSNAPPSSWSAAPEEENQSSEDEVRVMSVSMSGSVNTGMVARWGSVLGRLILVTESPEVPERFTSINDYEWFIVSIRTTEDQHIHPLTRLTKAGGWVREQRIGREGKGCGG